ncbi:hypothetical protein ACFPM0_04890 [Pseudonocardia sulfidoxydans]
MTPVVCVVLSRHVRLTWRARTPPDGQPGPSPDPPRGPRRG